MRVIIAAAGTAGHINPGIAIANKIMQEEPDSQILFIGTNRGIEKDLVPRAGYELKTIDAYGLSKKPSIDSIKKMEKTIRGFSEARRIIKEFKPDIVIGTGGYICGATISVAKQMNIPTVLHESNAYPGKAVKMLAKKTDTIFVAFEDAEKRITNANRIICSGTPVKIQKKDYTQKEKEKILKELNLSTDKPIVLVFGGSQGAQKINEAIIEIIEKKLNKKYQIIWATGQNQYDNIVKQLKEKKIDVENIKEIKILPYIYNMEEVMNISNLIIARSGAMTITEISNIGKPSILIPLPNVSNNHQYYNAKVLEDVGASKIILNDNLNAKILNNEINKIISNKKIEDKMKEKATEIKIEDVEERIYKEIERLVKKKKMGYKLKNNYNNPIKFYFK